MTYQEALDREKRLREAAFFLRTETILDVEVLPFTGLHFALLNYLHNPLIVGGTVGPEHCAQFMWAVHPEWSPEALSLRDAFIREIARLPAIDLVRAIYQYINDAFEDSPAGGGGRAHPVSLLADIVHVLAKNYGWTEAEIMRCPFKRVFQYIRKIELDADKNAIFINTSDRVRREELTNG